MQNFALKRRSRLGVPELFGVFFGSMVHIKISVLKEFEGGVPHFHLKISQITIIAGMISGESVPEAVRLPFL